MMTCACFHNKFSKHFDAGDHESVVDCCYGILFTPLHLDKMSAILAEDIFNCIFLNENDRIPIHISLIYVPRSPIENKPALV